MYRLSYVYGRVPGMRNIGGRRWQMRNRPGKMYIMWHLCQRMPGMRNRTGTSRTETGRTETGIQIIKNRALPGFFIYAYYLPPRRRRDTVLKIPNHLLLL